PPRALSGGFLFEAAHLDWVQTRPDGQQGRLPSHLSFPAHRTDVAHIRHEEFVVHGIQGNLAGQPEGITWADTWGEMCRPDPLAPAQPVFLGANNLGTLFSLFKSNLVARPVAQTQAQSVQRPSGHLVIHLRSKENLAVPDFGPDMAPDYGVRWAYSEARGVRR